MQAAGRRGHREVREGPVRRAPGLLLHLEASCRGVAVAGVAGRALQGHPH